MTKQTSQATISTIGIDIGFGEMELKSESASGHKRTLADVPKCSEAVEKVPAM